MGPLVLVRADLLRLRACRALIRCHVKWVQARPWLRLRPMSSSEFRHFCDEHFCKERTNSGNGSQEPHFGRRAILLSMTFSIRCLRLQIWLSSMALRLSFMPSILAWTSCFFRAAICARSRLRISTIWLLRVVKALRIRRFSLGKCRPASGLNCMNRLMSPASIWSVFARVPREGQRP